MKWPKDQVCIVESAFQQFIANCGHTLDEIRESYRETPPMKLVWQVWRQVSYDLQYDNSHPAYFGLKARVRLVDFNPNYEMYPRGCHDSHMKTMLIHVSKKTGLID